MRKVQRLLAGVMFVLAMASAVYAEGIKANIIDSHEVNALSVTASEETYRLFVPAGISYNISQNYSEFILELALSNKSTMQSLDFRVGSKADGRTNYEVDYLLHDGAYNESMLWMYKGISLSLANQRTYLGALLGIQMNSGMFIEIMPSISVDDTRLLTRGGIKLDFSIFWSVLSSLARLGTASF